MKKGLIIMSLGTILLMSSCGKTSLNAELGKSFSMMPDQTVSINDTDLKINGFEVTEDSRCPEGTNCIWEGQVVANFILNEVQIKLNTQKSVDTLGYTFKILSVSPIKTKTEIPLNDYILELIISQ